MHRVIAIIPARSGSKRIPNKNIVNFMGKPMIAWTIEAALKSGIFSDVLVSTDGEDIAEVSRSLGVEVPFLRNPKDADDHTPASVATINSFIQMEMYKPVKYDIIVQLMPNCPCRTADDIIASYETFMNSGANFQISVFQFGFMNPWWAMELEGEPMRPKPLFPDALKKRSQDLNKLYCPTGAIWIADAEQLKTQKTFYGEKYSICLMDWTHAVDIDNYEDFKIAQLAFALKNKVQVFK